MAVRYRLAFSKREQSDQADSGMRPSAELDLNLPEGVVAEKVFIEQLESEAQHGQEVLDEDDAFLGSAATEVWEYEVFDARAGEFEDAIKNSDLVLESDVVDFTPTTPDEASTPAGLGGSVYPPDRAGGNESDEAPLAGSGHRAGDDGPAGMPTGDPSAGGLNSRPEALPADEAAEFENGSGVLDELEVMQGDDPRLGLTNRGNVPPEDWAANTGPARNPDRGVETENPQDKGSTLGPRNRKKRR
jgi:hypothetical protein